MSNSVLFKNKIKWVLILLLNYFLFIWTNKILCGKTSYSFNKTIRLKFTLNLYLTNKYLTLIMSNFIMIYLTLSTLDIWDCHLQRADDRSYSFLVISFKERRFCSGTDRTSKISKLSLNSIHLQKQPSL